MISNMFSLTKQYEISGSSTAPQKLNQINNLKRRRGQADSLGAVDLSN